MELKLGRLRCLNYNLSKPKFTDIHCSLVPYHVCLFTVGDVSSETVESGAAYLFQLLHDKKRVTASEMHAIRNMFGPQTNAEVQAICDLVQK